MKKLEVASAVGIVFSSAFLTLVVVFGKIHNVAANGTLILDLLKGLSPIAFVIAIVFVLKRRRLSK